MSSNPLSEGKVDPRIKRTRGLLIQAFFEVMAEKGFQAASVQDITGKAGVNRTTFYLHFPDKYALVDYSIRQAFRQEIETRGLEVCHYTPENLRALITLVCEFITQSNLHCPRREPQFEALVETQVKKQLQELLYLWLEQSGSARQPQTAATAASWAIFGLALQWNHEKVHPPVDVFAGQVFPLIDAILVSQPV